MKSPLIMCFVLSLLLMPILGFGSDYVVLIHSGVNIRAQPSLTSEIIGQGSKGQIFSYISENDNWFEVEGFSDSKCYISKSLSAHITKLLLQHYYHLPEDKAMQRDIYNKIKKADKKARKKTRDLFKEDLDNSKFEEQFPIVRDQFILKIFQNRDIHPGLYKELIQIGEQKEW